ncbi:CheR family methyltransferase [Paenibacillus aurantiacus]|uniref:CheR family methyltransferase n=1 Tax=Paenibacillus aurantiacus TaxID=1936118 RepID=A0ABV5KY02_9BACL
MGVQPPAEERNVQEEQGQQERLTVQNLPARIIGIGASAGGLEGLKTLFQEVKSDNGLAFVVIQHLSPHYKSLMSEILAKYTSLRILEAEDDMTVEADTVYLAPSHRSLRIQWGKLRVTSPEPGEVHYPIDVFFRSLALEQHSQAIGIILSGTGSDGTKGATAIKKAGGIVFVQNEATAKFDGMPRSAIQSGYIDYVLSPEGIAAKLNYAPALIPSAASIVAEYEQVSEDEKDEMLSMILDRIRNVTNIDFSYYKRPTLMRRIEKRMNAMGCQTLPAYYKLFTEEEDELTALRKDLLIHVTNFFRDPEAFSLLAEQLLPRIFEAKSKEREVRIWTAGCSTGEEAYSLAMLVTEFMDGLPDAESYTIRIFATDVDKHSIEYANFGVYPLSIESSVSQQRRERFFTRQGDTYQVSKELRRMVVFAPHNLIKDPPFSNLDLITCRNMLIYLESEMQRKVLSLFHFALNPSGFLFLGPSETIGRLDHLFEPFHAKWNMFQHKAYRSGGIGGQNLQLDTRDSAAGAPDQLTKRKVREMSKSTELRRTDELYATLVNEHMPPSLLIDENLDVKHLTGKMQPFLSPMEGRPSWNVHKLLDPRLAMAIVTAVQKVRAGEPLASLYNVRFDNNMGPAEATITVKPFSQSNRAFSGLMLVLFEPAEKLAEHGSIIESIEVDENVRRQLLWLENQLRQTEERLHATIEELESSSEELQSTNEELIASNEELQSTNEELQAVNEELVTINSEYQFKIQELTELNNDMDNFLVSTKIGTIFLDTHLCIRRFTPAVTKEINLLEVDYGRPFSHISHNFYYTDFVKDATRVLKTLKSTEREVKSKTGRWYSVRTMPYRTNELLTKGVILTFVDITELKKVNEDLLKLSYAMEQSPSVVVITNTEGAVVYANRKYYDISDYNREETMGRHLAELNDWSAADVEFEDIWKKLKAGETWEGELSGHAKRGDLYWEKAQLHPIIKKGKTIFYMKISELITERKEAEEMLRKSEMLSAIGQLAAGIAHEIRNPLTSLKGFTKLMKEDNKRNYISIMTMELERIEQIVSELLILAKPQAAEFQVTALHTVLGDVVMLLETQAIMSDVQIEMQSEPGIFLVEGIANQLKQVFINLIKNGIEAMKDGGTIRITTGMMEDGLVWTSVQDEGGGIPADMLARLGEPFYTTKSKGTGLGLMMSYKIIENHQGKLVYESETGVGTTARVGLPVWVEPDRIEEAQRLTRSAASALANSLQEL